MKDEPYFEDGRHEWISNAIRGRHPKERGGYVYSPEHKLKPPSPPRISPANQQSLLQRTIRDLLNMSRKAGDFLLNGRSAKSLTDDECFAIQVRFSALLWFLVWAKVRDGVQLTDLQDRVLTLYYTPPGLPWEAVAQRIGHGTAQNAHKLATQAIRKLAAGVSEKTLRGFMVAIKAEATEQPLLAELHKRWEGKPMGQFWIATPEEQAEDRRTGRPNHTPPAWAETTYWRAALPLLPSHMSRRRKARWCSKLTPEQEEQVLSRIKELRSKGASQDTILQAVKTLYKDWGKRLPTPPPQEDSEPLIEAVHIDAADPIGWVPLKPRDKSAWEAEDGDADLSPRRTRKKKRPKDLFDELSG